MPRIVLGAVSLSLILPSVLAAQEQPAPRPLIEQVDVRLVDLDVTVTDRSGNPVTGLTKDDFVVSEDGVPVEIQAFSAIESFKVKSAGQQDWTPIGNDSKYRRKVVVLVDNNTPSKPRRDSALESLRDFIAQKFDNNYEWAVLAADENVNVVLPMTADRQRVQTAIDRIQSMPTRAASFRIDRSSEDPIRVQFKRLTRAAGDILEQDPSNDTSSIARFESRQNAARNLQAVAQIGSAMLQAFNAYGPLEGQKILLLVTGGFEMNPELGYLGSLAGGDLPTETGLGGVSAQDTQLLGLYRDLRALIDLIAQRANAAGFRIYTVKTGGLTLQTPGLDASNRGTARIDSLGAFAAPVEVDDSDSAQIQLAGATGGLALARNDLFGAFEAVDRDASVFYSLGYYPGRQPDGQYHTINVEVKRPGLVVRSRSGYIDATAQERLEAQLATPLTFEKSAGTLPVTLNVERSGPRGLVATAVLPMRKLAVVEQGDQSQGRVWAWLTIYDEAGQPVDVVRRYRDITFPTALKDQALVQSLRYGLSFELPKEGRYTIAVTLRDEVSGELGTAFAPFVL